MESMKILYGIFIAVAAILIYININIKLSNKGAVMKILKILYPALVTVGVFIAILAFFILHFYVYPGIDVSIIDLVWDYPLPMIIGVILLALAVVCGYFIQKFEDKLLVTKRKTDGNSSV